MHFLKDGSLLRGGGNFCRKTRAEYSFADAAGEGQRLCPHHTLAYTRKIFVMRGPRHVGAGLDHCGNLRGRACCHSPKDLIVGLRPDAGTVIYL